MVVEAKAPNESLNVGYDEARLYALELNSEFSHGCNTCKYVVAANGRIGRKSAYGGSVRY